MSASRPADKFERPEAAEVEVLVESNESLEVEPAVEEAEISDPSAVPASEKEVVKEAPEFGGMLFEEAPSPVVPKREKRAKKKDAVVTASVFIGIGNKPYLRGSGAGLNWEKGFPMDFEEIGKWSWLAPADLDESIEVQVYRNDEDPDLTGEYTLEPGQKLDLWPYFRTLSWHRDSFACHLRHRLICFSTYLSPDGGIGRRAGLKIGSFGSVGSRPTLGISSQ